MLTLQAVGAGWTDIITRRSRNGKFLGYAGKPPGYTGPHINIKERRLDDNYSPQSFGSHVKQPARNNKQLAASLLQQYIDGE